MEVGLGSDPWVSVAISEALFEIRGASVALALVGVYEAHDVVMSFDITDQCAECEDGGFRQQQISFSL